MTLPPPPYGLTLGWASQQQAREALAVRACRCVLKSGDGELWTVSGPLRLAEGYAKTRKRVGGYTVIFNERGVA